MPLEMSLTSAAVAPRVLTACDADPCGSVVMSLPFASKGTAAC